jgi:hypothetical protein
MSTPIERDEGFLALDLEVVGVGRLMGQLGRDLGSSERRSICWHTNSTSHSVAGILR